MKKLTLFCVIICSSLAIFAQNAAHTWPVEARTALFREGKETLAAKYPGIDDEKKSSVAICFMNTIEAKYPPSEWAKKTEAEIKKIKGDILAQCYASGGKAKQAPAKAAEPQKPASK